MPILNSTALFCQELTHIYLAEPARVLPNALWKTVQALDGSQVWINDDDSRQPNHMEASHTGRLLVYWNRDRTAFLPQTIAPEQLSLALIHQDFLPSFATVHLTRRAAFFRLVFRGSPDPVSLPGGFSLRAVQPETESEGIAGLIGACYEDIHPTPETVRGWMQHPVYDPGLWIWVWDERKDQPAGLGIAELDTSIGEGSLEWVQVLPAYRGLGLGQALVLDLLKRLDGRAQFVTVAGEVENRSNPERLYRRCGFTGNDIWWVLRT